MQEVSPQLLAFSYQDNKGKKIHLIEPMSKFDRSISFGNGETSLKMYAKEDDKRLVELFRQGDDNAFNELVNRHKRGVYAMAMGLCGNRDWADVVAQETFLRLHRYGHTWKGDSTLRTWLSRVTVNQARTELNKRVKSKKISPLEDEHIEMLAANKRSPQPPSALSDLLDELSQDHREALTLFTGGGYSVKEISQIINVPPGTVKSRICYAKRHLARLMAQRGVKP